MYLITNSANLIVEICEHPCYVRRQANGVVVLSEQDKADAIYSNDSNTFWPTQQVGYLCDRHTLVEVESGSRGSCRRLLLLPCGRVLHD